MTGLSFPGANMHAQPFGDLINAVLSVGLVRAHHICERHADGFWPQGASSALLRFVYERRPTA
jgi:hypothetical protein